MSRAFHSMKPLWYVGAALSMLPIHIDVRVCVGEIGDATQRILKLLKEEDPPTEVL